MTSRILPVARPAYVVDRAQYADHTIKRTKNAQVPPQWTDNPILDTIEIQRRNQVTGNPEIITFKPGMCCYIANNKAKPEYPAYTVALILEIRRVNPTSSRRAPCTLLKILCCFERDKLEVLQDFKVDVSEWPDKGSENAFRLSGQVDIVESECIDDGFEGWNEEEIPGLKWVLIWEPAQSRWVSKKIKEVKWIQNLVAL